MFIKFTCGNDPRWLIANISGLQLPVKAQRMRGRHTFRQIFVAHRAEEPQWRSHTDRQRDCCGWRSSSWSRVNRAGSPSDRGLEDSHGSPAGLLRLAQQL